MEVVVTGIGLVSCLGDLAESWQGLIAGKSGIKWHRPFIEFPPLPLGLIGTEPIELEHLLERVLSAAIADAGLEIPLPECAIVIGSSRAHQADWERLAAKKQASRFWWKTLPEQVSLAAARQIGAKGAIASPMAACATGIWAIARGFELIQMGQCQRVIAGAIEAPVTGLTLAGFSQMGALAKTGCYPFDRQREGLVLGEGGAVLVMENAELAGRRGRMPYGELLGFGLTCDAHHISAPELDGKSAILAIERCLQNSRLAPKEIDYIHAHGTATLLNDRSEANSIGHSFPEGVPFSSTKGATGHTLGASGALGAAFCLMALKNQKLPPCVGLKDSEFEGAHIVTSSYRSNVRQVLCFSFGFGGQNAVMALRKINHPLTSPP